MSALTNPLECYRGPMDGAFAEAGAVKDGVLHCGIVRRGTSLSIAKLVWDWAGPHHVPCFQVTYRLERDRLVYVTTEAA